MAGIEELRARAIASMTASSSTPLNPSHNPTPPPSAPNSSQSKEDGEISSSPSTSYGAKDKFTRNASTPASATQRQHSPVSLTNKHHENLKSGSSIGPNPLSKLDAAKNKMLSTKKDYHTNAEKIPYKSRKLTWHATSGSDDNLVISFSDDDTQSEPDDTTDKQERKIEDHMNLVERFKRPVATSGQPFEVLPRVSNDKNGMSLNSISTSHQSASLIRKVQGTNSQGSGAALLSNEVQLQKQHPGAKYFSQQDKKNIGDVFRDNKQCQLGQEILPQETDVNHQKIVNHGKRKISGISSSVCNSESEVTKFDKHLKSTSNKKTMKRLKADEQSHMKNKSITDEPVKLSFSFQKSESLNGNATSSRHCSKEGFVNQTDSQIDSAKGKNNKTILSSSTDFDVVDNMNVSIPFEGGVVRTMQNVKLPCLQGCQGMPSAGSSFNDEMLGQRVQQICCSPGSNQSSQLQKKISCAEDTAAWNKISPPDNLEHWQNENLLSHTKPSSFPQQVDVGIGSMLKLEELLDKELEKAQELRHKCELEERNAFQAYQKAQRALMDANRKCSLLYSKREYISAKLRALMMEASNSLWPTSCSNNSENILNLLKDLAGINNNTRPSQSNQMMNEKHNLELIGYGSNVGTEIADISSSSHQNVNGHALPVQLEPVDQTPHLNFANSLSGATTPQHNLYAGNDHQKYLLSSISKQSRFSRDEISKNEDAVNAESKRERENIQDYELEAELRSKLVARLGLKGVSGSINKNSEATYDTSKVDSAASDKIQTINIHNQVQHNLSNQLLLEEETNNLLGVEKVNEPNIGQIKGSVISLYDESPLNTNHESNTIQIPICSLPCLVLQVASKHAKFILPESNISAEKTFNTDLYGSMLGSEDNVTEYKSILSKLMNMDSYIGYHAIDPFWPFCMFELRGKCNDEECLWQHLKQQNHLNGKHSYNTFGSAYWIGPNLVKAEPQSSGSLLACSSWQYWQTSFCTYFCLPFPIDRLLPPYAPVLHEWGCRVGDDNNSKMLSLYLQSQDITGKYIFHGLTEPEQSLELALDLLNMKENRIVGRKKSLFVLSRSLEENTNNIVLWVVYLHVYYRKEKDIGKDDMFHHAVQHNEGSYELWLMYINSRMHFDQRMHAYTNAISALSRREQTDNMDIDYYSSCILDLFLQMMDFLCMSGKLDNAISIIHKLLAASIDENSDLCPFSDIFRSLVVSDRCILCICCIYIKLYRRLPEIVVQQHEVVKDLPFGIEWPFIQLSDIEKHQAIELIKTALDKVLLDSVVLDKKGHFEQAILRPAHFMAVSHVKFSMAVEGLNISADLLVKYLSKYPSCIELVMLSVYYGKILKNESNFEMFERALNNWPKQAPGIQRLWNQYAEYVLSCKRFDIANELLVRWFDCLCTVEDAHNKVQINNSLSTSVELPYLSLVNDGDHPDPEESTFGLLNLFLYFVLRKDTVKAQLAINEALKHAAPDYFKHCVREHAAFHFPDGFFSAHSVGTLGLVSSYIGDLRSCPIVQPLSRNFFRNIKKPRVRHLINNLVSPVSRDCTVLNSVLEDCYGPSLLPQEFDEPKDLVDFAEYLMENSPANYKLAISVHKAVSKNFGQTGISSASILFWASSLLVNCIFQALPVAPEQAWVEAASLLSVHDVRGISERFHRQGLLVYPFSVKLWESYYNLSKIMGNNTVVAKLAREKGIELV